MFHTVMNMCLIKLNKNLLRCHLFHKNIILQSQQIISTFTFNIIFTLLLPCAETLLITNSIHASWISTWFTRAVEYMILTSHHLPVQTHHNFRPTLNNLFGEWEEIHTKLHSIILILLQWVWPLSKGAKSFGD